MHLVDQNNAWFSAGSGYDLCQTVQSFTVDLIALQIAPGSVKVMEECFTRTQISGVAIRRARSE